MTTTSWPVAMVLVTWKANEMVNFVPWGPDVGDTLSDVTLAAAVVE